MIISRNRARYKNNRRWSRGEMARLEANLLVNNTSNIIRSLQSMYIMKKSVYKNLVIQLKIFLASKPDNSVSTTIPSNTPLYCQSPPNTPLNINVPTYMLLSNIKEINIMEYILKISNNYIISNNH